MSEERGLGLFSVWSRFKQSRARVHFPDALADESVLDFILRKREEAPEQIRHQVVRDLLKVVGATENELVQLCLTLRGDRNRWRVEARSVPGFKHVSPGVTLGAYVRSKCQNPNCSTSEIIDLLGFRNFESLCEAVGVSPPRTFVQTDVNHGALLRQPRRASMEQTDPRKRAQVFLQTPVNKLPDVMEMLQGSGRPEPEGEETLARYISRIAPTDNTLRGMVASVLDLPVGSLNAENGHSAPQDPKTESDRSAAPRQKKNEPKCAGPDLAGPEVKRWWEQENDLEFPEGVVVGSGSRISVLVEVARNQPEGGRTSFLREFVELNKAVLPSATTVHALVPMRVGPPVAGLSQRRGPISPKSQRSHLLLSSPM
ncbi:MAG: hypothetical protein BWY43_00741 [candidate division WS2 bacterium ADurb.Bin280]|uniref:Uncharacterized protein n=1 Tax=candidate division WS2 bacterium ADurb.Bin280 TaxID=1852829 RepID=A0A1V5SBQ5_9BACT|nr:MAG: hypothetical protein BWY43_00741 [candidate division WS2 bacterium ADurb.Bin280]